MVDGGIDVSVYALGFMYSYYGNMKLKIPNYVRDLCWSVGFFFFSVFSNWLLDDIID